MKRLLIKSKSFGNKIVLYDKEDEYLIKKYKWRLLKGQSTFYIQAWTPMINKKRSLIKIHNLVTGFKFVDHINGNGLDNRKCNLRSSNHSANAKNRKKFKSNKTSKYKGVFFWKQSKLKRPWVARITNNGKVYNLGFYATEKQAAEIYNKAAIKYFGEFAALNNIN